MPIIPLISDSVPGPMTVDPTRPTPPPDVRMRGFSRRVTVADALRCLDERLAPQPSAQAVSLADAGGRVLARDMQSLVDVPGFDRAMMDGFAVQAADTLGASSYNRLPLTIVGQVLPGESFCGAVAAGQAVRIMTGAPVPSGADAVLPAEKVEIENDRLLATDEVSPGKHIGRRGEDIVARDMVLKRGRYLRPQDLGVLSSIGVSEVAVVCRPRVRIVITGDELLPPGTPPRGNQIADANSPMLTSLVTRDGGEAINPGIVPDDRDAIRSALHDDADVILISGGSSVGQEDHAPTLLATHGQLMVHGIAMRPSSPAGFGKLGHRWVFLLPGNPVSCLCAYDFFAGRAIRRLAGRSKDWPYRTINAPLKRKLVSVVGRVDYARVKLVDGQVEPLAIGGASILTSTTRADGFVVIPGDSEGYAQGTQVQVYLYE